MPYRILTLVLLVTVAGFSVATGAETTRDAAARLAVDVVALKGGREVRGSIVSRAPDGAVTIGVRREWLQQHDQALHDEQDARETEQREEARSQLATRIRAWLEERKDDVELSAILRRELETLEQQPAAVRKPDAKPSEFLLVDLPAERVRRVFAQPPERRQVGLAAWEAGLDGVERQTFVQLAERLDEQQIDWRTKAVDLADRLPRGAMQDEREWAARQAVYEYAFRKRVEFQGTGDLVLRTDSGAAPAIGPDLLNGLLESDLGADLADLLGNGGTDKPKRKSWKETAVEAAEKEGVRSCRVTRMASDLTKKQVTVEQTFLARMPDGSWEAVWTHNETLDAAKERKDLEQRIRQDPQVAEAFKLLERLGGAANVETAVRFGAATMEAQQRADDRFYAFKDRYTEQLDGPPLRWQALER
jgi:hypothetical protein